MGHDTRLFHLSRAACGASTCRRFGWLGDARSNTGRRRCSRETATGSGPLMRSQWWQTRRALRSTPRTIFPRESASVYAPLYAPVDVAEAPQIDAIGVQRLGNQLRRDTGVCFGAHVDDHPDAPLQHNRCCDGCELCRACRSERRARKRSHTIECVHDVERCRAVPGFCRYLDALSRKIRNHLGPKKLVGDCSLSPVRQPICGGLQEGDEVTVGVGACRYNIVLWLFSRCSSRAGGGP
mmetsp:Transcript_10165/g.31341  ORF Transcript_10165/g.31341 Transcript_10165/m.31341 type:complete len:238 (+) Transcript_10165:2594-3307(+)